MRAFIFDTETTDLIANSLLPVDKQPHIVEFFGQLMELKVDEWHKIGEVEEFIRPPVAITETTTRITGITSDDLRDAPRWAERVDLVYGLMGKADIVVAHNLSFDMAMLNIEAERGGHPRPPWPDWRICTVEATEHLKGHRLNLMALHELLFGKPFEGAHRARTDVEATARCFTELWKRGVI